MLPGGWRSAARTLGGGPRAGGPSQAGGTAVVGVPPMSPSCRIARYWSGTSIRARSANRASVFDFVKPCASRMSWIDRHSEPFSRKITVVFYLESTKSTFVFPTGVLWGQCVTPWHAGEAHLGEVYKLEVVKAARRQSIVKLAHCVKWAISKSNHHNGQWEIAASIQANFINPNFAACTHPFRHIQQA